MTGFLDTRGDTITYQDIAFGRGGTTFPDGNRNQWNGNEAGVIVAMVDGETGIHYQNVYYQFANTQPDLSVMPADVYYDNQVTVVNETVEGPTFAGQTGPIFLANGNIVDCSLYVFVPGDAMYPLDEGPDYILNYATGEIDTYGLDPYDADWYFYAWYNYTLGTPSEGDVIPMDITVSNAGNGDANAVVLGLYDGDPTQGGALIDTIAAGDILAQTTYNTVYMWDTTGYEGFHTFCVIPDHLDAITESNENNTAWLLVNSMAVTECAGKTYSSFWATPEIVVSWILTVL